MNARWVEVKGARKDRVMLYLAGGAFIVHTPALLFVAASVPGIGIRRAAWPGAVTLVFGFACGLAFLLFERERRIVNT